MRWKVDKTVFAGDFQTIHSFSQFESVKEFDDYINSFLYFHKQQLTESALEVIKYIRKFIAKHRSGIGVCAAKQATIAKAIKRSTKSVQRAIELLFKLGFLLEPFHSWQRKDDGKSGAGHLILVVQKLKDIVLEPWNKSKKEDVHAIVHPEMSIREHEENPCESKVEAPKIKDEANAFLSSFSKDFKKQYDNKDVPQEIEIQLSFSKEDIPNYVPHEFINVVWMQGGFTDPMAIKDMWDGAVYGFLKVFKHRFKNWKALTPSHFDTILKHAVASFRITKMNKNNFTKNTNKPWSKRFSSFFYGVIVNRFKDTWSETQVNAEELSETHSEDWLVEGINELFPKCENSKENEKEEYTPPTDEELFPYLRRTVSSQPTKEEVYLSAKKSREEYIDRELKRIRHADLDALGVY